MSWKNPIQVTPIDEFLVIGAVRYARGRHTYVVEETCSWVINHWDELSENTQNVIARDVREELQHHNRVKDELPLSMYRINTPFWEKLLEKIEQDE